METVYLETTFVSYLTAPLSRELIVAAHQQLTVEWWETRRSRYDCFISEIVKDEASQGDNDEVQKRIALINKLQMLELIAEARLLTREILSSGVIPEKAVRDAAHIAVATVHAIDYLLTWNCRHLANAHILKKIDQVCARAGYQIPVICTPIELMEEQ